MGMEPSQETEMRKFVKVKLLIDQEVMVDGHRLFAERDEIVHLPEDIVFEGKGKDRKVADGYSVLDEKNTPIDPNHFELNNLFSAMQNINMSKVVPMDQKMTFKDDPERDEKIKVAMKRFDNPTPNQVASIVNFQVSSWDIERLSA